MKESVAVPPNTVSLIYNLEKSNHRLTGYTQMKEG